MASTSNIVNQRKPFELTQSNGVLALAWFVILAVSALPNIFFLEFANSIPGWLLWAKIGFLVVLALVSIGWKTIRPLAAYFVLLAVLYLASELFFQASQLDWWQARFRTVDASFSVKMLGDQAIRLTISLAMIVTLLVLGFRRRDFFLVKGQLDALAAPEWLFGMKQPEPWSRFGWKFMLGAVVALGIFLGVAAGPMLGRLPQALPLLPIVLLLAMLNAFNEELSYRAALLAPLYKVVGERQSVFIAAAFFGLAHYTGVPYGVTGVVMSTFLGWALGKAMIETKGFFWAWLIHFVMDVMIFSLMAVGSITPGGG